MGVAKSTNRGAYLHPLPNIILVVKSRRMRWAGLWNIYIWERRDIYSVLVGKPEGKRPLGRHRRRWKENIKMDLKEMLW